MLGRLIGRDSAEPFGEGMVESGTWIGRPWRRLELITWRHYYRGESLGREWMASATLGLRRLGLHFHASITWAPGRDYSEEPNQ